MSAPEPVESVLAEAIARALAPHLRDALAEVLTELWEGQAARPALLSLTELGRELGVSRSTIYRMREQRELPEPFMVGDSPRWELAEVLQRLRELRDLRDCAPTVVSGPVD